MKFIRFVFVLFVLIGFGTFETFALDIDKKMTKQNKAMCTPGETKMQDCNKCKCDTDGTNWVCTSKTCPPRNKKILVNDPGFTCTPNETFKDDCNTCMCDKSGVQARCTTKPCDLVQRNKRSQYCQPGDMTCEKDDTNRWNQCYCTRNGFKSCTPSTEKFCQKFLPKYRVETTRPTASPPTIDEGGRRIRTISENELDSPNFRCSPGETFKVDCNTCWCSRKGNEVKSCTRIACHPKIYATLNQQ